MTPKVTIVIPFFNDVYITQAVESALSQSYRKIEIIVVDDGSTKHTELINPYLPHIHYLGKKNGGTASALNHGIRYASGEYIAWLSSDDVFYMDKIKNQLSYMLENNAAISHTNFDNMNENSQITQHSAGGSFSSVVEFYKSFLVGNSVNGCTVMMSKHILNSIGLFNERLPYTHDLDLWYRVILSGHSLHYLNQSLTAYRWHPGMGTIKHRAVIEAELHATQMRYQGSLRRLIGMVGG